MAHSSIKSILIKSTYIFVVVSLMFMTGPLHFFKVYGAQAQNRMLQLSDNTPSAHNVIDKVSFGVLTPGTLGSVEVRFCSNSSLVDDPCTAPVGLDASSVTLSNQSGVSDFTISSNSTINDVILTRTAGFVGTVTIGFDLGNMTNPTSTGSYYARVYTYVSQDGSGPATDSGGLAFSINDTFLVSAEVPPYLIFCTGTSITGFTCSGAQGDQIDLGELSSAITSSAQTQFLVATNAESGYSVRTSGTTLTSGNNIIPAMSGEVSKKGVSQFGLNLRANSDPEIGEEPTGGAGAPRPDYNLPNHYRYKDGDAVAGAAGVQDYKKYTVSYVVNVNKDQDPGVYATTLTYICVANF